MVRGIEWHGSTTAAQDREAYERFHKNVTLAVMRTIGLQKYLDFYKQYWAGDYEFQYEKEWLAEKPEDRQILEEFYESRGRKNGDINLEI